jgi:hypothetical protein
MQKNSRTFFKAGNLFPAFVRKQTPYRQLNFAGCCGLGQLPDLKSLNISVFKQLFAPMQPAEKPIVGTQSLKIYLYSV